MTDADIQPAAGLDADPAATPAGVARAAPGPAPEEQAEAASPVRPLPNPSSPVGQTLARMAQVDPGFDPQRFLAPMDGKELKTSGDGARIAMLTFMIAFGVIFLVTSQSMIGFTSMFGTP